MFKGTITNILNIYISNFTTNHFCNSNIWRHSINIVSTCSAGSHYAVYGCGKSTLVIIIEL